MLGGQITGGSTSVRDGWDKLRIAGAQARMMLVAAAAQKWGVDASEVHARRTAWSTGRAARRRPTASWPRPPPSCPPPKDVKLKDPSKDSRYVGKPLKRLDTAGQDQRHGRVRHRRQAARHAVRRRSRSAR